MDVAEQVLVLHLRDNLVTAIGPEQGMTLDRLATRLQVSRRMLEQLIEHHLQDLPFVVVAGSTGYFRPNKADQINAYKHNLRSRHHRLKQREDTVDHKAKADGWPLAPDGTFMDPVKFQQGELFAC